MVLSCRVASLGLKIIVIEEEVICRVGSRGIVGGLQSTIEYKRSK